MVIALVLPLIVVFAVAAMLLESQRLFLTQLPKKHNKIKTTIKRAAKRVYKIGSCNESPKYIWFLNPRTEFLISDNTSRSILSELDVVIMPRAEQEVCWRMPVFKELVHLKTQNLSRPVMLYLSGEVYNSRVRKSCDQFDAVLYRSLEEQQKGCPTIHFIEAVQTAERFGISEEMLTHTVPATLKTPTNFCTFITKSVFLRINYKQADALIRHAMMNLISEYKPCKRIYCRGGVRNYWNTRECFKQYKFAITMENTAEKGYVSEKLVSGMMGDTMQIYFGAPDIDRYVNTKRFVHCKLPAKTLESFRSYYIRPNFYFNNHTKRTQPSDRQLVAWATEFLRSALRPCVAEVIRLDNNQTAYEEKLRQPFFNSKREKNYYFGGGYEKDQLLTLFKQLQ